MGNKITEIKTFLVGILTVLYAYIVSLFGSFTPLLIITVVVMFSDLITRMYAAKSREDERIESKLVIKGIYKKLGMCILIVLTLLVDTALIMLADVVGINVVSKIMFTALVMAWILVRELISNIENLQHAGIEIPEFLNKILGIAKEKVDSTAGAFVDRGNKDAD